MKVDYAFVAEAADSQAGLFYVTRGGADVFFLPREFPRPLRLGAVSFVVRLMGDAEDIGRTRSVVCTVVDADGRTVGFRQEIEAEFDRHPIDPTRANARVLTFRFYGFPVPEFGTYVFEVWDGEERLAEVPIWVVPVEPGVPQGDGPLHGSVE
jgi:hypothetical protein